MRINLIQFFAVAIIAMAFIMFSSIATETTWRHSGFELWGYDINCTDHNLSNVKNIDAENITSEKIGGVIYANEYDSIQDAINNLTSGRTWKERVIINGNNSVSAQINISNYTIIENNGVIRWTGADGVYNLFDATNAHDIEIQHGIYDGDSKVHRIINIDQVSSFSISDVTFMDVRQSGAYVEISQSHIGNIYNNRFDANQKGLGINIFDGSSDIVISDNIFNQTWDSGIDVGSSSGQTVSRIALTNNIHNGWGGGTGFGIKVFGAADTISIMGGSSSQPYFDGYAIYTDGIYTPNNIVLSNVIVYNSSRHGFHLDGTNITISNAQAYECKEHGFWINANNTYLSNIVSIGNFKHGIAIYDNINNVTVIQFRSTNNGWRGIGENTGSANNRYIEGDVRSNDDVLYLQSTACLINIKGYGGFSHGNIATAPTPYGAGDAYYNSTDNKQYYYTGTVWDAISAGEYYGEGYFYNNAVATVIETADTPIAVRGATQGQIHGLTYDAGSTGAITAYADGTGGTVIVSDASHGLSNGDIITIRGTTNYNGIFEISSVTTDTFKITDTWVNDNGASDWDQPAVFTVPAGGAGVYKISANMCTEPAAACSLTWQTYVNNTAQNQCISCRKYAINDADTTSSSCMLSLVVGDRIWLAVQSDDTANIVNTNGNFNIRNIN